MFNFSRFSLLFLFSIISSLSFGDTIIWSEDWSLASTGQIPSDVNSLYSYTNGGGSTKIFTDKVTGEASPELLVAKSKGSVTIKINLKGASDKMTLSYKANKAYLHVSSPTSGVTIGSPDINGNLFKSIVQVPNGLKELILTFTNIDKKNNVLLGDIMLSQSEANNTSDLLSQTSSIIDFDKIPEKKQLNFKGGIGALDTRNYVDGKVKIMYSTLRAGAKSGLHKHERNCEVAYIISGEATFHFDGREEVCRAGQVHYCPQGHSHYMENRTDHDIVYLTIVTEHHQDDLPLDR